MSGAFFLLGSLIVKLIPFWLSRFLFFGILVYFCSSLVFCQLLLSCGPVHLHLFPVSIRFTCIHFFVHTLIFLPLSSQSPCTLSSVRFSELHSCCHRSLSLFLCIIKSLFFIYPSCLSAFVVSATQSLTDTMY